MKTLVIVSHPDILESGSQQYFLNSVKDREDVTIHHLEGVYPQGKIDVEKELALLRTHQRIIFQFPFYWYSSPYLLKKWQDEVLTDGVAYGRRGQVLAGKEFGLVVMIGVHEREYQAGGTEGFSLNELLKPFQAMANKTGMKYLKPLPIFQFAYMEEAEKMDVLVRYWQILTMENDHSLLSREKWLVEQLEKSIKTSADNGADILTHTVSILEDNEQTIDGLKVVLDQIREG